MPAPDTGVASAPARTEARPAPRGAVVTGGGRGIGGAIVHALTAGGIDVVAVARSADELAAIRDAAAGAHPGVVHPLVADLADRDECAAVGPAAAERLGHDPQILVHAAGIATVDLVPDVSLETWDRTMQINLTALLQLSASLLPGMIAAGTGRIVGIGSLYARMGVRRMAAYTTSKHALIGLVRVLAAEHARQGITANTVVPGWIDTEMTRREAQRTADARSISLAEAEKFLLRGQPIGRMIEPSEVADLVAYLCGPAASAITGQAIDIDGGSFQG